jgi:hypothetical protein
VIRHRFDKADVAKKPDDRGFEPEKPAVQRGAFHEDDVAKMAEIGTEGPPEGRKARGIVKHRFAKADLAKMADDREFEPEKPTIEHGTFHKADMAKMADSDETGPAEGEKVRGIVKHKFAKADLEQMGDDRGEVARPAGLSRDGFGPGVSRRSAAEETDEEAAERRRRKAGGLLSSGHGRQSARDLAGEARRGAREESDERGDAPAAAAPPAGS